MVAIRLTLLLAALATAWGLVLDNFSPSHNYDSATGEPSWTSCDIRKALAPQLSENSTIVLPGEQGFSKLEIRASSPRVQPSFTAIVEPTTEEDVQSIVNHEPCC